MPEREGAVIDQVRLMIDRAGGEVFREETVGLMNIADSET
jgi:hypothetical protein